MIGMRRAAIVMPRSNALLTRAVRHAFQRRHVC